jgi:hypothetical protein
VPVRVEREPSLARGGVVTKLVRRPGMAKLVEGNAGDKRNSDSGGVNEEGLGVI